MIVYEQFIEPVAREVQPQQISLLVSIAVSLKRIADGLQYDRRHDGGDLARASCCDAAGSAQPEPEDKDDD